MLVGFTVIHVPESRSAGSCDCAWAVGEGRKGVSKGGLGRERGGREREEASVRSLQTEEEKKCHSVAWAHFLEGLTLS